MGRKLGSPEWRLELFMYEYIRPAPRRKKELMALSAFMFDIENTGCLQGMAEQVHALGKELRHKRASRYFLLRSVY